MPIDPVEVKRKEENAQKAVWAAEAKALTGDCKGSEESVELVIEEEVVLDELVEGESMVQKVIVVCPTSLVKNWDKEFDKWLSAEQNLERRNAIVDPKNRIAISESNKEKAIADINCFLNVKSIRILIISYETFRIHAERF